MTDASAKQKQDDELCPYCKQRHLWSPSEREMRICNYCADRMYQRYQDAAGWNHYHPR